jgi:hypothetical protein
MDPQPELLVQQIADDVERRFNARFDAVEERLGERRAKTESELKHQAKLNKEDLADQIKKAADGYFASLALLDRKLDELHSKWDTQLADHAAALANHGRRISALERARRR